MGIRFAFLDLILFAAPAFGASVTIDSATATIAFLDPAGTGPHTRSQSAALGDHEQFTYDGYDGETPSVARGDGLVFYSFQPDGGGFQLYVQERHHTLDEPLGAGGSATFSLTFTNSVPLKFAFESNVTSPPAFFSAVLPPIEATAQFAGPGAWNGTIPHTVNAEGKTEFSLFARNGIIPAGTTSTLSVAATTYESRFGNPSTSEGFIKFNVEPVPTAVPLPPALWPAMLCMVAMPLAKRSRRRRV